VTLIRAENKRTQLCLQTELAEEKSVTSLTEVTAKKTTTVRQERKKSLLECLLKRKFCIQAQNRPETF